MADIIETLALAVQIVAAWVRVPAEAATKMGLWDCPLHRRCPNDPKQDVSGRPAHDS